MRKSNRKIIIKAVIGGIVYTLLMEVTFLVYWFFGEAYDRTVISIIMIMLGLLYSSREKSDTFVTTALAFTTAVISIFVRIALSAIMPPLYKLVYTDLKSENFEASPFDIFIGIEHNIRYIFLSLLTLISAIIFCEIKKLYLHKKSDNQNTL